MRRVNFSPIIVLPLPWFELELAPIRQQAVEVCKTHTRTTEG
jgi:hypothetical protein